MRTSTSFPFGRALPTSTPAMTESALIMAEPGSAPIRA